MEFPQLGFKIHLMKEIIKNYIILIVYIVLRDCLLPSQWNKGVSKKNPSDLFENPFKSPNVKPRKLESPTLPVPKCVGLQRNKRSFIPMTVS